MNLQEKLQQLAIERQNLTIAIHEINGAMKLLEQQILEIQAAPESSLQEDKEVLNQQLKKAPSK